jgi:hypothetical protein
MDMGDLTPLLQSAEPFLFCAGILLPLAFLGLRYNYRFALRQATFQSERDELAQQYRLLLICLALGVPMVTFNLMLIGLPIAILLLYLAARIVKYRVTVLAAHSQGKFVCVGNETIWAVPVAIAVALFVLLLVFAPILRQLNPQ